MGIEKYMKDVMDLDHKYQLEHLHELNMQNLSFFTLALGGEVGELLNVVKKMWRDGETPELWKSLEEEIVDIVVYLMEIINLVQMDFDRAWDAKLKILYDRFEKKKSYRLDDKKLTRGGELNESQE